MVPLAVAAGKASLKMAVRSGTFGHDTLIVVQVAP